jgi:hypothetical protein
MPSRYQNQPDAREIQKAALTQQLMAPSGGLGEIMQTIQQLSQMQAQQQTQQQQAQRFPLQLEQDRAQLENYVQSGKQSKKASKMERKKGKKELQYMDTNEARAAESAKRDADRDAAALVGQMLENTGKAQAVSNTSANQPFLNQSMQNNVELQQIQKQVALLEQLGLMGQQGQNVDPAVQQLKDFLIKTGQLQPQ